MPFAATWIDLEMNWVTEQQEVWMEHIWQWTDILKLAGFMEEIIVSNLVILYRFENFHSKKPDYMKISFFNKKIKILESL